jgi:hypothetical protein
VTKFSDDDMIMDTTPGSACVGPHPKFSVHVCQSSVTAGIRGEFNSLLDQFRVGNYVKALQSFW